MESIKPSRTAHPTSEVSLHTALEPGVISGEVLGLLLERQISILEPCLRKYGVQTIVRGLLRFRCAGLQSS